MNVARFNLKSFQPPAVLIYLIVIAAAFALAHSRVSSAAPAPDAAKQPVTENAEVVASVKPFFSLATNRTFGTTENPRMWVDFRGIDKLDFRVYRVTDPPRFFSGLGNPPPVGE